MAEFLPPSPNDSPELSLEQQRLQLLCLEDQLLAKIASLRNRNHNVMKRIGRLYIPAMYASLYFSPQAALIAMTVAAVDSLQIDGISVVFLARRVSDIRQRIQKLASEHSQG